jgi:D-lactate dehydrogenase
MLGFGARVLVCDPTPSTACLALSIEKVDQDYLFENSDIISLHTPLNTSTKHIINDESISKMKKGVIIINTGRGGLIDTAALIRGLESKHINAAGLDVYENERGLFFENHSNEKIKDELFLKLQSFSNVIITGHIAFFSQEAINNIARTTIENVDAFENGVAINQVGAY